MQTLKQAVKQGRAPADSPTMLPMGLCANWLAMTSISPTTWCARISVAFAAATALEMMATPASAPLISVLMDCAAAGAYPHFNIGASTH